MKNVQLIDELIKMGESEQLELQQSARKEIIARTVCSFLNGEGGQFLIGVSDAGKVIGVKNAQKLSAELQQYLIQEIIPEAPITVSVEPYEQKEILSIKVWGGSKKPYLFDGNIFYRRGASTVKASSREMSELIHARQKTEIHWERQSALGVELEDLDLEEINATIDASIKNFRAKEARSDVRDFLSYYGLALNGHFTNAAVVLFAKNPARFLPQCRVRLSYLQQGKTSSIFKDDQLLEGNLFKNIGVIQDFFNKHLELRRSFSDTKWQRQDDLQYPLAALREGVLNALVHRDYSNVSGSMSITIFPDKLEITNFGSLALKTSELKKSHLSLPVNPDIAQIVFLRGYIEKIGRGTLKIIEDCKAAGLKAPVWSVDSNSVKLTFFSDTKLDGTTEGATEGVIEGVIEGVTEDVKDKLKRIIITLSEKPGLRAAEISKKLKIPISSLERYIKQLRDAALIEFRGASKTGGYYLLKTIEEQIRKDRPK